MANQFANSMIADKVDRVAKATGLSIPAVVELALDPVSYTHLKEDSNP